MYQFPALLALTGTTWVGTGSVPLGGGCGGGEGRGCGGGEGRGRGMGREVCQSVRDCVSRYVDYPLKNNSSIFNACLQQAFNFEPKSLRKKNSKQKTNHP